MKCRKRSVRPAATQENDRAQEHQQAGLFARPVVLFVLFVFPPPVLPVALERDAIPVFLEDDEAEAADDFLFG